jgi:hypothetical protein
MMSEPPSGADEITPEELAAAVGRATEAGIPVAVVELRGPGQPFEPPRGAPGARYGPDTISVRELTPQGSGALDSGVALYPPPGEGVDRVIVVPLERGNWLPYTEALEEAVAQAAASDPL